MEVNSNIYNISAEDVLNIVNHSMVYEYYFHTPLLLNQNIKSPIRKDDNPSCKFIYDHQNYLILFDYAKGKSYNIIELVSQNLNISFFEAKKQIIKDFIFSNNNTTLIPEKVIHKKKEFNFQVQKRSFTEKELEFWSIGGLNITEDILHKYGVGVTSCYSVNKSLHFTQSCYYFINNDLIQIYRPDLNKNAVGYEGRYRSNTTKGLYNFLDGVVSEKRIITKSFRDAFYLSVLGFNVSFVISEGIKIALEETDYILFDNDFAGIENAEKLALTYKCKTIYYPKEEGVKDTVDYLKKYGYEKTKKYLCQFIN